MPTYKNTTQLPINNIEDELGIIRSVTPNAQIKTKKLYNITGLIELSELPYYTPNLSSDIILSPPGGTTLTIKFNRNGSSWLLINDSKSTITIYYNHIMYDGYKILPGFTATDNNLQDKNIENIYLEIDGEIIEREAVFHQFR